MKNLLLFILLISFWNVSASDGKSGKSISPITIGEETRDSSIIGDSCRFYIQIIDKNSNPEIDSVAVSIFHHRTDIFPSFKFFNLLTDSLGRVQLTFIPGKYFVKLSKTCIPDFNQDFEFEIEKLNHSRHITYDMNQLNPEEVIYYYKPVIYCYPEKEMELNIKLITEVNLTFTYPKLNESWQTKIYPNGDIEVNNKMYPYLFWEGDIGLSTLPTSNEGFIVENEHSISFFEEKLTLLGLNQKEQTDFITFWCPKMTEDTYEIKFLVGSDYDKYIGKLKYSIQPDSEIRIFAVIKVHNGKPITEQVLSKMDRKGFAVIEWGGSIVPNQKIKL